MHLGVDFGCPTGTPVYAPAPGRVIRPNNDGSFGIAVAVQHSDGWISLYAHLSRADVWPGDEVRTGQQLGLSGATGFVTGPHLHWQLCDTWLFPRDPARNRDPLAYYVPGMPGEEDSEMSARLDRLERIVLMLGEALMGDPTGRPFAGLDELERVLEQHRVNQTRVLLGLAQTQGKQVEIERLLMTHTHGPDGRPVVPGRF
jgi:murein DD-endopeptidase MepM/ murein hydrolase activator NlpD